ncbi:hypothetical protein GGR54DRAFT_647211 [Hypoxylon sp. NC1633]|nr:hypothetical protein GGR54DRAFT_647211 [Hypoxylon sp. NC1633]
MHVHTMIILLLGWFLMGAAARNASYPIGANFSNLSTVTMTAYLNVTRTATRTTTIKSPYPSYFPNSTHIGRLPIIPVSRLPVEESGTTTAGTAPHTVGMNMTWTSISVASSDPSHEPFASPQTNTSSVRSSAGDVTVTTIWPVPENAATTETPASSEQPKDPTYSMTTSYTSTTTPQSSESVSTTSSSTTWSLPPLSTSSSSATSIPSSSELPGVYSLSPTTSSGSSSISTPSLTISDTNSQISTSTSATQTLRVIPWTDKRKVRNLAASTDCR